MIQAQPTADVKSKCRKHTKHYRSMSGKSGTDKQAE